MTSDNQSENARLELELAAEVGREAEALIAAGLPKGAVSRTYYFALHLARALLYTKGLESKSREGVHHLVGLHFVRPGIMPRQSTQLLGRLSKYRQDSDYDFAAVFSLEDAADELAKVREMEADVTAIVLAAGADAPGEA